ncbi:MAG TPA: alginate export family protein [Verrucomicrobiae bacterium]|nr:alginate export family protein [Verrucomicrobiae bacterium]
MSLVVSSTLCRSQNNQAATANPPANGGLSSVEQTIKDIKQPVSWLAWGSDVRLRNEYLDNTLTLSPKNPLHEQDYFRFRARLWASVTPIENLSFNARLATEPREWLKPAGYSLMKGQSGLDMTEGVVDNLNVKWGNILGRPMTLVVGRQDLLVGDGWLVGDGTPYDGSWTYYLDAARLSYELKDQHTLIEAIGIVQDAKNGGWLPTINQQDRYLTEQNEKGALFSVGNTTFKALSPTVYFVYKHDDRASGFNASTPAPRGGDNGDIYTFGSRISGLLGSHWKYWVEGAYQVGQKQDTTVQFPTVSDQYRDIYAFGANTRLSYLFHDAWNNQLTLSYEFLSGDDPRTKSDEMFDVLWGRWPRWSEIGLYSFAAETRIGQEANLHRLGPTWSVDPIKNLNFGLSYFALLADQEVATRGVPGLFSGTGTFRGHFVQAVLKYKFSQHVSGHLWSEFEFPGDYYVSRSVMSFLRAELAFTF